jgi:flagellar L-ring protein precursor FlgH
MPFRFSSDLLIAGDRMKRTGNAGLRVALLLGIAIAGSGCQIFNRLAHVGEEPPMTQIQNPVQAPHYTPVSLPMPAEVPRPRSPNSLWRHGARAFFKDQRAMRVGDLVTITISIDENATLNNTTTHNRTNATDSSIGAFLGYETSLSRVLPETINPGSLVDIDSSTANTGTGTITRDEKINLSIAAVITQKLPNGNLVVLGRQEIRVNFEVRQLQIAGIVRPEDITAGNTISSDKIAEARISYGGKGHISDLQQPRYGQQIYDIIWPF